MAKRIKSDKQIETIADWSAADELIKQIGELQLKIKQHEATAAETITEATETLKEAVEPINKKITVLTDSLEAFAANHTADFDKAQSRKLNFGILGWRKSTAISIKNTTLELIKKVFGKKADQYIRIEESVIKETLKDLTDRELASLGARRVNKEPFFVEPDLPEAVDL